MNPSEITEYLKRCVSELEELMPPEHRTWEQSMILVDQEGHRCRFSTRPAFHEIIAFSNLDERFTSAVPLIEQLTADERFKRVHADAVAHWRGEPAWLHPDIVILSLLVEYTKEMRNFEFDESLAQRIANNFFHSLDSGTVEIRLVTVLRGVKTAVQHHMFPNDVELHQLTGEAALKLIDDKPDVVEEDHFPSNACVLERRIEMPVPIHPPDYAETVTAFDQVVTALRLLKEGRVERQIVHSFSARPGQIYVSGGSQKRIHRRYPIVNQYDLAASDLPATDELVNGLCRGDIPKQLEVAVDRMDFAAERERVEDQLLDVLIALEALYSSSPGEIGYKLRMRCARFLETDAPKQKEIIELIVAAYKERGALVHGEGASKREKTAAMVPALKGLVRKTINQIVKRLLAGKGPLTGNDFDLLMLGHNAE